MTQDSSYEAIRTDLLNDMTKECPPAIVERAKKLLEALEGCALKPTEDNCLNSPGFVYATVSTNEDVKRLTTVNAIAVLSMLVVAVVALGALVART